VASRANNEGASSRSGALIDLVERWREWGGQFLPLLVLLVLVVVFSIANNRFLTLANLSSLLQQSSVLMIVAFGVTFVIIAGSIDLSIGSIVAFAGVLAALATTHWGSLALFVGLLAGLGAGLVNGAIFAYVKVPSFLVTLGMLSILQGAALIISGGFPVVINDQGYLNLAGGTLLFGIPNILLFAFGALVVAMYLARYTRFGRNVYMIGSAEQAAKMSGVPVDRYKVAIFGLSGAFCGLAGALLAARLSSAASGMESLILLDAIAAVIIGGTALTGGVGNPLRSLVGVLIISVISNGLAVAGVGTYLQISIKGLVVILAVALSIERAKLAFIK
jgi:ribose transport system permease protein